MDTDIEGNAERQEKGERKERTFNPCQREKHAGPRVTQETIWGESA